MTFIMSENGYALWGREGVGSYDSAATLTVADLVRVYEQSLKPIPQFVEVTDLTPRQNGLCPETTGEIYEWAAKMRGRNFDVPSVDVGARPDLDAGLAAAGFIDVYDDGGGGGPYTITYTPQDYPDLADSVTIGLFGMTSDGANKFERQLAGARCGLNVDFIPGQFMVCSFVDGSGQTYTPSDDAGAAPTLTYTKEPVIVFQPAAGVTLGIVGGTSYNGPIAKMGIQYKRRPSRVPGGNLTGFSATEHLPGPAPVWTITIEQQLGADWDAETIMRNKDLIVMTATIPVPAVGSSSSFQTTWYGQIIAVEPTDGPAGHGFYDLTVQGIWSHASTPGQIPVTAYALIWSTV